MLSEHFPAFLFGRNLRADGLHGIQMHHDILPLRKGKPLHHADFQPHRCKIRIKIQLLPLLGNGIFD